MNQLAQFAHRLAFVSALSFGGLWLAETTVAQQPTPQIDTRWGDKMIADYFAARTAGLSGGVLNEIVTAADWNARKDELRRQLHEMLGLDPLPERTPLNAVVTGTLDHPEFTVEKLHFQSSPQLYVTGNLYVPKGITKPVPAILYVCGHGNNVKNGVSYGSKTAYQHHGAWFARHGYVCLIVDTLQLGEIEGLHHGVYREEMFWWYSRGYTPAGVEVWNGIRAIDYLQSRKEVDPERIGLTGRSGGGAMTWYIAACDERVKAAVPVAGITDLEDHVVDPGCIEGHCDCMFQVNTYGWDYGTAAALVAPRPLLISNTDDDGIFPLDGVERIHWQVKKIYGLLGAAKQLGLQISWGGHKDTQELQVAAFRWFNLHLKHEDPKIEIAAVKLFEPEQLKVFDMLPEDQRNTTAHEWFVPRAAKPQVPRNADEWSVMRDGWLKQLREKSFRGWPETPSPLSAKKATYPKPSPITNIPPPSYGFESEPTITLGLTYWTLRDDLSHIVLQIAAGDRSFRNDPGIYGLATTLPRGVGDSAWDQTPKKQNQNRRRFMLLGQTLEGQQIYDVVRAIKVLHNQPKMNVAKITLRADGPMAALAVYAALFEPSVTRLELTNLPASHMPGANDPKSYGPPLLGVLKFMDLPQAVAMAAERATVVIHTNEPDAWQYPVEVAKALGWKDRVIVQQATK